MTIMTTKIGELILSKMYVVMMNKETITGYKRFVFFMHLYLSMIFPKTKDPTIDVMQLSIEAKFCSKRPY